MGFRGWNARRERYNIGKNKPPDWLWRDGTLFIGPAQDFSGMLERLIQHSPNFVDSLAVYIQFLIIHNTPY